MKFTQKEQDDKIKSYGSKKYFISVIKDPYTPYIYGSFDDEIPPGPDHTALDEAMLIFMDDLAVKELQTALEDSKDIETRSIGCPTCGFVIQSDEFEEITRTIKPSVEAILTSARQNKGRGLTKEEIFELSKDKTEVYVVRKKKKYALVLKNHMDQHLGKRFSQ